MLYSYKSGLMKKTLLFGWLIISSIAFAGSPLDGFKDKKDKFKLNNRVKYPAGFNLYGGGAVGLAALSFDYFITPKLSLEVGAGVRNFDSDLGFTFGGRYHFFGKTPINVTPYIGVYSGFEHTGSDFRNYNLYIPFGIHRVKRNRFTWSIEVGYQRNSYEPSQKFFGGGRLGFRF